MCLIGKKRWSVNENIDFEIVRYMYKEKSGYLLLVQINVLQNVFGWYWGLGSTEELNRIHEMGSDDKDEDEKSV